MGFTACCDRATQILTFCRETGLEVAILLRGESKLTLCHILLLIQHAAGWILYLRCMAVRIRTCIRPIWRRSGE